MADETVIDHLVRVIDTIRPELAHETTRRIAHAAYHVMFSEAPPGHVEIVTNGTRRIIPEDEPVFLLRGRDPFAAAAVENWADEAERGGVRPAVVSIARAHADKMRQWPTKQLPGSTKLAEEG